MKTYAIQQNRADKLPVSPLCALALAGFITILTEALPAGMLPQIGHSLAISNSLAGQLVSVYALGSLLAAIPLMLATQRLRRRPLLLFAVGGFALANTVTAFSASYWLTLTARFIAGVSAGLLWALIAGYAARLVQDALKGRAIALAMVGTPLALSVGIPLGSWLSEYIGWRNCFYIISGMTLFLMGWIQFSVPDFPGQAATKRLSLRRVFLAPGIRPVLAATLIFVLAHNIIYTYIAPLLQKLNMGNNISAILLVFGLASIIGIWGVGLMIDRWLGQLTLAATALFAFAMLILAMGTPALVFIATAGWGLAFGGAATLFQTAVAKTAGEAADVAQSMLVTAWNLAIAGGGLVGAGLLNLTGVRGFSSLLILLLFFTWLIIWSARRSGFSSHPGT
ncbi:MFS transporter [Erwinia billingiae Eb661]|uniref:MFS transporter n=1 Tax=Erwinia billingiae (strain Eb661) TaxID=634500 RepID=D8MTW7_ERWBE|nr:MFS transporter [Erwinia billingiae]CAX60274.1 MFS transporter [Erwinia billingiae Eb661]